MANNDNTRKNYRRRLEQIEKNWGRFEPVMTQPAGQGATVEYLFRNGKNVSFVAHQIDIRKILDDVKAYIKSRPAQLDHQKINIGNIGHRLVTQNERKYIRQRVAEWQLDLDPSENHFDRRITVSTPLQKAGAYLLTARMQGGNTSKIILWLSDTAIVKKPLADKTLYYVADAVSGEPIAHANLELFGFRQRRIRNRHYEIDIRHFAEHSDTDGLVLQPINNEGRRFQWLATATTEDGRLAYLGFTSVWHRAYHDAQYNQTKAFAITDRPVYRPKQKVQFKCWLRRAQYDQADVSQFAGKTVTVIIHNPKGEKVLEKSFQADEYGGVAGELELPGDTTLGVYRLNINGHTGGCTFRVEEYKKPEFEVTVEAPSEPVMLGEKITATIRAKYYFGSPVTDAQVKVKVLRTSHNQPWYPAGEWDWLYGKGYWWFGQNYDWYPGWRQWGCRGPSPWWWPQVRTPPEVVAEQTTQIGPDGTVKIDIDTALAKAVHGDQDHRYTITAEVVDRSRRTIVGTGQVLAARQPFKVFAWGDRGYYRTGDTIRASFTARTLDGKPVSGTGQVELLSIRYDEDSQPLETVVQTWNVEVDAQGTAKLQMKAAAAGQYRLRCRVTDGKQHTIEGGFIFTVIGEGFDGSAFRFNDLELVADRREYKPGDVVKLQINTNRTGAAVLLFLRPSNGVYLPPKLVRLSGKSAIIDVVVAQKDMPNFFVEAVTVHGAKLHTQTREIHVPPVKRVLNVQLSTSAKEYKPGENAKVTLKLTDQNGAPFVGSTVLAIYDKSVEYIAGGSNVANIQEFFWKWRRRHTTNGQSNLNRRFGNLVPPKQIGMANLGVFGDTVADELRQKDSTRLRRSGLAGVARFGREFAMQKSEANFGDAAAAPMAMDLKEARESEADGNGGPVPVMIQPTVRQKFADTALWKASLTTNAEGLAEVELDMPENLTTWKVRCWAMGHGTRVGQAETEVVTRKNLIVRLQAPRFFVETDEVVLSANVHNYLDIAKQARVELHLEGDTLTCGGGLTKTVEIPAGGEALIDWRVKVVREGQAMIRMSALTDEESDAMQMSFPVYVHGMSKMESFSGAIRPEQDSGRFTFHIPAERRPADSRLEVRYSPTLAGAMVDALPYMIDYPYGCTEQTLNRFLPAVITQKVLIEMGLDLQAIRQKRTNLNAQEIGDDVERAKGWRRYKRNPVFDRGELDTIVKAGVERLTEMQLSDGGWGWFSGYGEHSYPHTTAVVVHGLQVAAANDVALVPGMLDRGVAWLERYQAEQVRRLQNVVDGKVLNKNKPTKHHADNLDAMVHMVLTDADKKAGDDNDDAMRDFLYRDRTRLAVYGKAVYALALHKGGHQEKLAMLMRNIEQFVVEDNENQTAYLNLPGGHWWYWYGSEFEAHAYYLKLLAATDPQGERAARLVKYLLNNRKHASYWNSTRDTALCIEALADFLKASGEDRPDLTVEVWLDGTKQKEVKITAADLFTFDNKLVLTGDAVTTGQHTLELKRRGKGPLYWNAYVTNFTLEEHITRAGLELKVRRKYYKLTHVEKTIKAAGSSGQVLDQKVEKYERTELPNLATLQSGDLVEIELTVESKNDYEYILLEDMKAAGFEPVDVRSGYRRNGLGAYVELRDDRVSLFIRHLARGRHSLSYRVRAEIPGRFSALPTRASAMYAPELRGNSDELKLLIRD